MAEREWPAIKQRLDAGHLVPLGLIKYRSAIPHDLCRQHQILTYGYDLVDGQQVALAVYDPNYPDRDDIRLTLTLAGEPDTLTYSPSEPVFCFFQTHYERQDPPPQ